MEITRRDWFKCDGEGHVATAAPAVEPTVTRRSVVTGLALGAISGLGSTSALAQLTVAPGRRSDHVLISVFLRGGADGLNMVVPYGDDGYHRSRPELGLGGPKAGRVIDLDGFFGLNASLSTLLPSYRDGDLSIIHACGSGDQSRSHFEAMNTMERGLDGRLEGTSSGWLARYLTSTEGKRATPLRAVSFSRTVPDSLRGATNAMALQSLSDYRLELGSGNRDEIVRCLNDLYSGGRDPISAAGRETLSVLQALNALKPGAYVPSGNAMYPQSDLGNALKQVAFLVKADVGLEVACVDKGGWDTHYGQNLAGQFDGLLVDLAQSLAALRSDLGEEMARVTVVVQTEFGRRLKENRSLGTDHGRGSCMLILGKGVPGGKVHGTWPGLDDDHLDEVGDLRVTSDYRSILAWVLENRLHYSNSSRVFGDDLKLATL